MNTILVTRVTDRIKCFVGIVLLKLAVTVSKTNNLFDFSSESYRFRFQAVDHQRYPNEFPSPDTSLSGLIFI